MKSLHALVFACLLCSCGPDERNRFTVPILDECDGLSDRVLCNGNSALSCRGGDVVQRDDCTQLGLTCAPNTGCRVCEPSAISCEGSARYQCTADGTARNLIETCGEGLQCSSAGCRDLCAEAAKDRSYLGCEYWPVFTSNRELSKEFFPAVSIGNGNLVAAHVSISRGGAAIAEVDVAPQSATTVNLTYDEALRSATGSRLLRQGAYHLVSNAPVTVHQFNPLLFELPQDCVDEPYKKDDPRRSDGVCYSYTNDASLLFPSSALAPDLESGDRSVEFYALSRAAFEASRDQGQSWEGSPGFVAITGAGSSKVHVRIESAAFTEASPAGSVDPLPSLAPGGVLERDLMPGDVLQLISSLSPCNDGNQIIDLPFCDPGANFDLTGTHITADGPVQVISGHDCSHVPFNRVACDHLEESMTPLSTWGNTAVLSVPSSSAGGQYMLRVLSGADDNLLSFDPPLHEPTTLARGQALEFNARESMVVRAKGRFLAGQYLVGANGMLVGDPSLSIAVPVDQYRQSYNFVSPSTYVQNIVDIIATDGDIVTLDGNLVTGFTQVGTSRFRAAKVALPTAGAHEIHGSSAAGFAIVLYGLGSYTSYMLPGGLALTPLVIGI